MSAIEGRGQRNLLEDIRRQCSQTDSLIYAEHRRRRESEILMDVTGVSQLY